MTLENLFKERLLADCVECEKLGLSAHIGRRMVLEHGAIEAAKRLIQSGTAQKGFISLMKKGDKGRQCTMENRIVDSKFSSLFEPKDVELAKWRLDNWEKLPIS
ncbi:MAG: hypothetical protein ZNDK_0603 [Candidatus Desulfovibrio kirbyi]|jgi:hypothetical protein|uniref:Uncharacterized protein n=1 Tax=Candidatus Desulfovibrio kirbyi TaxID=2696086 RepID=A0A6L2R5V7_9BACT|nr:MAG: hypothetical protein ZNDK_0603 [Candidatus Desulfovibrio kirbyi]